MNESSAIHIFPGGICRHPYWSIDVAFEPVSWTLDLEKSMWHSLRAVQQAMLAYIASGGSTVIYK